MIGCAINIILDLINRFTAIKDISKSEKFEDLPPDAQRYVLRVQELLGVPVKVTVNSTENEQNGDVNLKVNCHDGKAK